MFRRTAASVGGTHTKADLVLLREPATGQTAFVQVKSRADQAILNNYIARFEAAGLHTYMFFICHLPQGRLSADESANIHVWARDTLVRQSLSAGLLDWLIEKST